MLGFVTDILSDSRRYHSHSHITVSISEFHLSYSVTHTHTHTHRERERERERGGEGGRGQGGTRRGGGKFIIIIMCNNTGVHKLQISLISCCCFDFGVGVVNLA